MTLGTILLIVLILLLVGALPTWPHSRSWGYGPTGGLGLVVLVVVVLLVTVTVVVVVVLPDPGKLSGSAGSVPWSSSVRSGNPSSSRSMPIRTPDPGGTQV